MAITQQDADNVRQYVKALPAESRSEFIKRYASLDSTGKETLVQRLSSQNSPKSSEEIDYAGSTLGAAGALGALGAAAVGGKQLSNYLSAPSREVRPIDQGFKEFIKQNPGAGQYTLESMPEALQSRLATQNRLLKNTTEAINAPFDVGIPKLQSRAADLKANAAIAKSRLSILDSEILSKSVDDISSHIVEKAPEFLHDTYRAYGQGISKAESIMEKAGHTLPWDKLDSVVLKDIDPNIKSALMEQGGLAQGGSSITISKAKAIMKSVVDNSNIPQDVRYKAFEKYARFLEENATPEANAVLKSINSNYRPFVKLRESLGPMKGGAYKTQNIYSTLLNHAQGNIKKSEESVGRMLKALSEGSSLSKPMEGLGEKVGELGKVKAQRSEIANSTKGVSAKIATQEQAIARAKLSREMRLKNVEALKAEIEKIAKWKDKVEELVRKKADIIKKYPFRSKLNPATLMKLGSKLVKSSVGVLAYSAPENFIQDTMSEATMGVPAYRGWELAMGAKPTEEEFKKWRDRLML